MRDGTDAISWLIGFEDADGVRRFNVHVYTDFSGKPFNDFLDPKFLLADDGTAFKLAAPAEG